MLSPTSFHGGGTLSSSDFELGLATGRLFAPDPFWLAGYCWGTWIGMIGKTLQGYEVAARPRTV